MPAKEETSIHHKSSIQRGGVRAAIVWFSAAFFYLYEYLVRVAPSVMKEELQDAFSASTGELSNAIATYYYIYAPMQIVVGILFDKFGGKRLLLPACLTVALGCVLMASGLESLWVLSLSRFLMGLGSAFGFVGVIYLVTIWYPPHRVAFVSGMTTTLGMAGAISGESGLARFVEIYGWQASMLGAGAIGVVLAFVLTLIIPHTPEWEKERIRKYREEKGHGAGYIAGLKKIMANPQSWFIAIVGATLFLPMTLFAEFWAVPYVSTVYDVTKTRASDAVMLFFFGFLVGGPILGWTSDALMNRRGMLMWGSVLVGSLFTVFILFHDMPFWMVKTFMFVGGFMCASQVVCFVAGIEVNARHMKGTSIAFVNMVCMLLGGYFQEFAGRVLDWKTRSRVGEQVGEVLANTSEDYRFALMVMPLMVFAGALVTFFMKPIHYKRLGKEAVDH